ncbi:MAG TPA: hypothetical protein VLX28_00700 [Thermoanaerobaculia bacterium]|nr:hypothetical protein [Thermoanaerobaculia bacterium]
MGNVLRSGSALDSDGEGEPTLWNVEYPEVASWVANEERKKKEAVAERRRLKLGKALTTQAVALLGEEARARIEADVSLETESRLHDWSRRALYAATWEEITGAKPIEGMSFVSGERLIRHAIDRPLNCWCVLLLFTPSRNEELDYDRVRFGAPWIQERWDLLSGVVDELRRYQRALVACSSERLARGLAATIKKKQRLWAWIYGPHGSSRYEVG